ncbi:MAG TPA: CmcJ/NvfI family oxidoreductase [Steroidobacteraceae bacterium]|nr:CmcJ/NvfI family oxidoreductase [Steroidobacteraceae bacterium]
MTVEIRRRVEGLVNYIADMGERPRYYANNHSRDVLVLDPQIVSIEDARERSDSPSLCREGYQLVAHRSSVVDFKNSAEVAAVYPQETERLLLALSGADRVVVNSPGVLRFGEKSADAGKFNNSMPARFIHVDISDVTAQSFAVRSAPKDVARPVRRFAHYNVWRALSPPPQDIPLAICDARTVTPPDLMEADAVFDVPGTPEWSFEGWVVRYNSTHRWSYFSGMSLGEALVFKTNDSDAREPHCVPHSAFDDPSCPTGVPPRASIEMRGIAYWFG